MTKPIEYIEQLEKQYHGFLPTGLPEGEDYVEQVNEEVQKILPEEIQRLLIEGRLISKAISYDGILALTKPLIDSSINCYAVVMSNGLRRVVYAIARVAYQVMYTRNEYFDEIFDKSASQLTKLFYSLLELDIPQIASAGTDELPNHIIVEASFATQAAEKFFLLHEYAHVWLYESNTHDNLTSHEREYYCDTFSSILLISNLPPMPNISGINQADKELVQLRTIYTGMFIALSVYDIAGEMGLSLSESHPSGLDRQRMLRRNVREHFGNRFLVDIRKQSLVVENFLNEVRERVELKFKNGTLLESVLQEQIDQLVSYIKKCRDNNK